MGGKGEAAAFALRQLSVAGGGEGQVRRCRGFHRPRSSRRGGQLFSRADSAANRDPRPATHLRLQTFRGGYLDGPYLPYLPHRPPVPAAGPACLPDASVHSPGSGLVGNLSLIFQLHFFGGGLYLPRSSYNCASSNSYRKSHLSTMALLL